MTDLVYSIGKIDLNYEKMSYSGKDPSLAPHKFVVQASKSLNEDLERVISLYVGETHSHTHLSEEHDLDNVVGGGTIYVNKQGNLVIGSSSDTYGSVPTSVAKAFGEKILPIIKYSGVDAKGLDPNSNEYKMNPFWFDHVEFTEQHSKAIATATYDKKKLILLKTSTEAWDKFFHDTNLPVAQVPELEYMLVKHKVVPQTLVRLHELGLQTWEEKDGVLATENHMKFYGGVNVENIARLYAQFSELDYESDSLAESIMHIDDLLPIERFGNKINDKVVIVCHMAQALGISSLDATLDFLLGIDRSNEDD